MRAQFIRGTNPKKSMGIGLVGKWMSLKSGDLLLIKKDFTTNSQNEIDDNSAYHQYISTKQSDFLLEVNFPPELYDDGAVGFTVYVTAKTKTNGKRGRSTNDYFIWGQPEQLEERMEPINLTESAHFIRGLDPKKSMKIGKIVRPCKKGDHIKVWVPSEKRLVEVRIDEDEETDANGNPKIRKMISNVRPAYEVRRVWIRYLGEVRTANLIMDPESPEEDKWIVHE